MSNSDPIGIAPLDDDVTFYTADKARLRSYQDASEVVSRFEVPRLIDSGDPHERLYIAAFDGTGNDADKDPAHKTNVAKIRDQISAFSSSSDEIYLNYLSGPGTQVNPITRTADAALGYTYEGRIERMYADLTRQANHWHRQDPDVQIRVLSTGFSRGASQAAGFTNLLHERGIVDLESRSVDANGEIIYTRHIAAPGLTPQAVGLFDPVATGFPERFDRRLAPSVVSGLQITAMDEARVRFPSDQLMPPGVSSDGRFLNLQVAGAHSDIGGGYLRDGLAVRSCNLMTDYCNALRPGAPFLQKVHEPSDPRLNVVHRSDEGMLLFQLDRRVDRATPEGVNARLAPDRLAGADAVEHAPRPLSPAIERGPSGPVPIGPVPSEPDDLAVANLRRIEAAEAAGIRPASGATKLARSLSHGAAVVTTGVEAVSVAHDYSQLRNQGNLTAARATVSRSASTGAGAWLGFEAGMAVGSPLGPGALATGAVGAVIGGVAGDKLADAMEHRRIYTQRGSDGNTWQADPTHPEQGWRRQTLPPLPSSPQGQYAIASPALADELNYKAVAKATELGMAAATARDPFKLPASSADGFSGYGGDWRRNPANGEWQRQINYDKPGLGHTETAAPERTQQLDSQSRQIVADNAARSPAALAAAFSVLYAQNNWQAHGKLPEAVENNLAHPQRVTASNGLTYDRNANGQWTHDGVFWNSHADGNLRTELELAVVAQREHVQKLMHPGRGPEPATPTLETVHVTPSPEQQAEGPHAAPAPVTPDDPDKARPVSMEHQSPQGPHGAAHHARDEGTPRRLADLRPGDPSHALCAQIAEGVSKLDAAHGRSFDETSERLTASLLVRASESGLSRVDHVLLNMQTAKVAAGEKVFLVQGDPSDPLHKRVTMATMEALQTPVEVSLAQLPAAEERGRHVAAMQMDQQAVTMQAQPLQMG